MKKKNYFKNIAVVIIGYASLQIPVVIIVLIFNKSDLIAIKGAYMTEVDNFNRSKTNETGGSGHRVARHRERERR